MTSGVRAAHIPLAQIQGEEDREATTSFCLQRKSEQTALWRLPRMSLAADMSHVRRPASVEQSIDSVVCLCLRGGRGGRRDVDVRRVVSNKSHACLRASPAHSRQLGKHV